jgi:NAD(P)H dehydrogenase (quinone)
VTTIAVTGAAGRLGSQVVRSLAEHRSDVNVVAMTRRSIDLPPAVVGRVADYDDRDALISAMVDVHTLVLISSDGETARVLRHHLNLVDAAQASNVQHIVALSGLDAVVTSPFCYAITNGYTEQAIHDSGIDFTFVRASLFTEFFLGVAAPFPGTGALRLPAGDGRVSLVSRDDVGRCLAALALLPAANTHVDVTGPQALHMRDIAGVGQERWKQLVSYEPLTPEQYMAHLATTEDPWWAYAYTSMFASIREHRWETVSGDVERITGRPPTTLAASMSLLHE